jgi:two-component system, LytTR family, response regulator
LLDATKITAGEQVATSTSLLIVTKEFSQRAQLLALAEAHGDLRVVGEAHSGTQAIYAARALRPDLLLLDAELPDMSGFDVLRSLRQRHQKSAILITANARDRAIALAAGAIDCLMKPVVAPAFSEIIQRACVRLRTNGAWLVPAPAERPRLGKITQFGTRPMFLVGEREHCLYPLEPEGIDYVESEGNYVKYVIANVTYIARESVKRLETVLAPLGFVRIERSLLLNTRAIAYVQPVGHGTFAFTLLSGARLQSGRTFRDRILAVLPLRRRAPLRDTEKSTQEDAAVRAARGGTY